MAKKKVDFKKVVDLKSDTNKKLDDWVRGSSIQESTQVRDINKEVNEEKLEMFRFTIIIPKYLHKRIKKACVIEDVSMTDKLTEILENHFPES